MLHHTSKKSRIYTDTGDLNSCQIGAISVNACGLRVLKAEDIKHQLINSYYSVNLSTKDLIPGPALHNYCILRTTYVVQTFKKKPAQGRFGVCETKKYGSVYDYSRVQMYL